jgi:hypothetical protein
MQEKMAYAGQSDCYAESQEILSTYLLTEVSITQVQRVTNKYGALLEEQRQEEEASDTLKINKDEIIYIEADGSMIYTREEGWKEFKVGRFFKESDCLEVGGERGWISHSEYDAFLGDSKRFTSRFEQKLEPYCHLGKRLVFISDGAPWIKNWVEDTYPSAIQILDWYHAIEHLADFALQYFEEEVQRKKWIERQEALLNKSKTEQVIVNIKELAPPSVAIEKCRQGLIQYYESNKNRMDYKKYRSIGTGIIGSGAIEAAHRNLVQKRLKQSGQRWSKRGAQHILALRCVNLSEKWNKVIDLINLNKAA